MENRQKHNRLNLTHHLILVYGAGSGFGKSSLSKAICERLLERGLQAHFIEEHETLNIPEFQDYVNQVHAGQGNNINVLTQCCEAYLQQLQLQLPEIPVFDSILPCWDWLYSANCTPEAVTHFSKQLYAQLTPFKPLLIIIEGDAKLAFARAVASREPSWALNIAEKRTGVRSIAAYQAYQSRLREAMEPHVTAWPYKLIRVDTTTQTLEHCVTSVFNELFD